MKKSVSGFVCVGVVLCGLAAPAGAQEQQTPPATQPPVQTPVPQEPPADTGVQKLTIPPLPKIPDVLMPGERGISIGVSVWPSGSTMEIRRGHAAASPYLGDLDMHSNQGKFHPGGEITIAAGKHNTVRISYFEANAGGQTVAPTDMTLWTAFYNQGTVLSTNYHLQSYKAQFEYLTWPYPVKTSRFRLRTLWGIEYNGIRSNFDAPQLPTFDANGNPIVDASGNQVVYATKGSHWFASPTVGISAQEYITRAINVEFAASGFAIPHHQNTWDGYAAVNVRLGHYEIGLGGKAYHFRSSPQADYWMRGTLYGPFVALRWHSDDVK